MVLTIAPKDQSFVEPHFGQVAGLSSNVTSSLADVVAPASLFLWVDFATILSVRI